MAETGEVSQQEDTTTKEDTLETKTGADSIGEEKNYNTCNLHVFLNVPFF